MHFRVCSAKHTNRGGFFWRMLFKLMKLFEIMACAGMRLRADLGDLPEYDDAQPLALLPKADQATIKQTIDILGTRENPTPAEQLASAHHISGDSDLWAREATGRWSRDLSHARYVLCMG